MKPGRLGLVLAGALAAAAFYGCEATPAPSTAAGTTGTGGSGGATSSTGQGGVDLDAGNGDAPLDEDAACAAESVEAELVQLDMVVLLDRSGSMLQGSKWSGATSAIQSFVNDPASAGIGIGLQVFPSDPDGVSCDYHDYDDLLVDIADIGVNAGPIAAAMAASSPAGNTPMFGALKGVLLTATAHQDANPDHEVIVLLASDGQPGGCTGAEDEVPVVAELIQSAYDYNGVETYVIAFAGSDIPSLDLLAAAGGTVASYDVTADISELSAQMSVIRGAALACEILIPAPPDGEELDPAQVNVTYTAAGMGSPETVPRADGFLDCGDAPGWYYDDPSSPTKILLCPASCEVVQADQAAVIRVLFGCTTIIN